jgi:hypothetical protein
MRECHHASQISFVRGAEAANGGKIFAPQDILAFLNPLFIQRGAGFRHAEFVR